MRTRFLNRFNLKYAALISTGLVLILMASLMLFSPQQAKAGNAAIANPHISSSSLTTVIRKPTNHPNHRDVVRVKPLSQSDCGGNIYQLIYHCGSVLTDPNSYLIFWGTNWSGSDYQNALEVRAYFGDVGASIYGSIVSQYYKIVGSTKYYINDDHYLRGVWFDNTQPTTYGNTYCGGPTISDATIQQEITQDINYAGWSSDANTTFYIYLPPGYDDLLLLKGTQVCNNDTRQGFCGYHSELSQYGNLTYAALPYTISGCNPIDNYVQPANTGYNLTFFSSHEQFEAITDPDGSTGWYDSSFNELADLCPYPSYVPLNIGSYYWVTYLYSNVHNGCTDGSPSSTPTPTPPPPTATPPPPPPPTLGDFNGDGKADVVAFSNLGSPPPQNVPATSISEWLGKSGYGVTFNSTVWSSVGLGGFDWTKAAWMTGDFNHDGYTDIIAAYNLGNATTGLYEWTGGSSGLTYHGQVWSSSGFDWTKARWVAGDFNGDGYADIIATYNLGNATTGLYEWTGGSSGLTYHGQVWSSSGFDWTKAAWMTGDFNGDGYTDIMAAYNIGSNTTGLYEWTGGSSGLTYRNQVWSSSGFDWTKAAWMAGDFNHDGYADVMAAYNIGSDTTGLYEWTGGSGGLTYHNQVWSSSGFDWTKAKWVADDFNGDGYADVIAAYNLGTNATGLYEWTEGSGGLTYHGQIWSSSSFDWTQATFLP